MEVALQMVGYYQHRNVVKKGVHFVEGRGVVRGADELVGNIVKYLEQFGAYPIHEAEKRQAVLDRAAGRAGDMRGAKARQAKARRELQEADDQLEEARMLAEQRVLEQEAEKDGAMETAKAPEGRGSQPIRRAPGNEPEAEVAG